MPASTPTAPFLHGFRVRGTAGDYTDTLELEGAGLTETPWDETEVVDLTRSFLADRRRFLHYACS
jgi:hypothetical protein